MRYRLYAGRMMTGFGLDGFLTGAATRFDGVVPHDPQVFVGEPVEIKAGEGHDEVEKAVLHRNQVVREAVEGELALVI